MLEEKEAVVKDELKKICEVSWSIVKYANYFFLLIIWRICACLITAF